MKIDAFQSWRSIAINDCWTWFCLFVFLPNQINPVLVGLETWGRRISEDGSSPLPRLLKQGAVVSRLYTEKPFWLAKAQNGRRHDPTCIIDRHSHSLLFNSVLEVGPARVSLRVCACVCGCVCVSECVLVPHINEWLQRLVKALGTGKNRSLQLSASMFWRLRSLSLQFKSKLPCRIADRWLFFVFVFCFLVRFSYSAQPRDSVRRRSGRRPRQSGVRRRRRLRLENRRYVHLLTYCFSFQWNTEKIAPVLKFTRAPIFIKWVIKQVLPTLWECHL